jgi:hypothetical protein
MILDYTRTYSVLIGDKWLEIKSAEPSELASWINLDIPSNFLKVNVREDSITAVRYRELPEQQKQTINTPWTD